MLPRRAVAAATRTIAPWTRHPCALLPSQRRTYALSRFEQRSPGSGRVRPVVSSKLTRPSTRAEATPSEDKPSIEESELWETSQRPPASDPEEGLRRLLMENDQLIVTRQVEMLNIFLGFEQSNRYVISNDREETLGFIAEEPRGFFAAFNRQILRTHRPFRALVMDSAGSPILWLRRPFAFVNSRMYVQRLQDLNSYTPEGEPILDTFAEAQQVWHMWRRKYDLFLRRRTLQILSKASDPQPEPEPEPATFHQFGRIDEGLLAWDFTLKDGSGHEIASISRSWRGFAREIFTDTGRYSIQFGPRPFDPTDSFSQSSEPSPSTRNLSLDERAAILAMAVNIDFDYFSRHSRHHGPGLILDD
ncbi:Scramblase-domain-containing protein [Cristinia sonorae]|uniref:Phospholipid scramblase n=1 Tax=Cristinia sonorae TaxID=1940300 RepID=A0A8K0UWW9_9AGAR|nr:Scramblase-domain-containing protein [Cristinia sonorae]